MKPATDHPFFRGAKPRVIGHRGTAGEAPENTLPSFRKAAEQGAAYVELDVRLSKDEETVIIHDARLERTTDGRGRVRQRLLRDLKTLDAGYRFTQDQGTHYPFRGQNIRIPTLAEFFTACPEEKAIIELKPSAPSLVRRVIETVCQFYKEEQVLLATEKDSIMDAIRQAIRQKRLPIATGFSYGEVSAFMRSLGSGAEQDFAPHGQAFQIPSEYGGMTLVHDASVAAAHRLGLEVFVWTVNSVDEMKRLLALGVDGIITDYPARMHGLSGSIVSG